MFFYNILKKDVFNLKKPIIFLLILSIGVLFVISGCDYLEKEAVGQKVSQKGMLEGSTYTAGHGEKLVLDAEDLSNLIVLRETSPGSGIYTPDVFYGCIGFKNCNGNAGCFSSASCDWSGGYSIVSCKYDCGEGCGGGECKVEIIPS